MQASLHFLFIRILYILKLSLLCLTLISFAVPIQGIPYLILVDPYSNWPEVIRIKSATVINTLRQVFISDRIPKIIVFRNVTQFSSTRFKNFFRGLNTFLIHSPSNSNGLQK
ncbi:unnamed protein product [Hymenolepis diminuta]|uniref:Uncharacterized protein n=1 Tax=Hymenolepis diminuta TaxID=6216 RepID=A0A564XXU5_HYMDI|nr:unnamed protein product [Hymenolepis diminuta]